MFRLYGVCSLKSEAIGKICLCRVSAVLNGAVKIKESGLTAFAGIVGRFRQKFPDFADLLPELFDVPAHGIVPLRDICGQQALDFPYFRDFMFH